MSITAKEIDEPYIIRNGYVLFNDGSIAQLISDPVGSGAMRQIEKMNFDTFNQLKVVQIQPALVAGTANIGVIGSLQKLLANPYTDTSANLAASAVYTGASRDLQIGTTAPYYYYGGFSILTVSDKTGTLFVEESQDNTNWYCVYSVNTSIITDDVGGTKNVASMDYKPTARYIRLKYKNTHATDATTSLLVTSRVIGRI